MTRRAPGFTLLEVLMAMVIGSVVVAGGFALVMMTERMDRGFSARLETTMELGFVQRTISRSMQSIVVAPEGFDPIVSAQAAGEEARLFELYSVSENREDFYDSMRELNAQEEEPLEAADREGGLVSIRRAKPAPARFRMGHLNKKNEWEYRDGEEAAAGLRRVELLLVRSPFGDQTRGAPVRGALDLVPTQGNGFEGWRLQWTPISPAGKPTVLLDDLVLAEWSVTDSTGQYDEFSAYVESELPWALRTILWTADGLKVDWMFDLGAASSTAVPL